MDSLKTKITSAKQMSKIDFVNFADGLTWAAATYKRVIFVPEHARICGFGIHVNIVCGSSTGTNTITLDMMLVLPKPIQVWAILRQQQMLMHMQKQ